MMMDGHSDGGGDSGDNTNIGFGALPPSLLLVPSLPLLLLSLLQDRSDIF